MMGLSGQGVSRDDTGGVEAAEDSCEDGVSKSKDGGEDEQVAACGDCEKLQGWWMVSPWSGDTGRSQKKWWVVKLGLWG